MNIGVQCGSWGDRCGIATYTDRLVNALNTVENVNAFPFVNRMRQKCDLISIQYEPGMCPPNQLQGMLNRYSEPIVISAHHNGYLNQFYPLIDGIIFHSKNQIIGEPWEYTIIKHPAVVYPKKDKKELRKKYGLPLDKKIIGTAGFICGTGKKLPRIAKELFDLINEDEYLYFITSFWKGGDFGNTESLLATTKAAGKEKQFRLDSEFVPEDVLNEKMQCCDLLFTWNNSTGAGGTSGIGMDMLGAHTKTIVKDAPHYAEVSNIPGIEVGRPEPDEFAEDVFKLLRKKNMGKVPDPEPYSWESLAPKFVDYYKHILGE